MNALSRFFCRVYQTGFRIALPVLPYREPKVFHTMDELAAALNDRKVSSVLLVVDGAVHRLGLHDDLERALVAARIDMTVYEQNTPNPTIDDVEAARTLYEQGHCNGIIALGGGSAMDCAKVVSARIARPRKPVQKMKGLLRVLLPTPPFAAIPTTAGTGSEATLAAVITDSRAHHKYPINDFPLIPDYAVLDASLTVGLPPHITATTGMDALTHAVEAYIGRSTTKLTRAMAEEAVTLVVRYLRRAYDDGSDLDAREGMLRAAYCAGVAFTRSYVGYVHGVAHALGGQYGIAHGLANAVILPQMLERYGAACHKKLAQLARIAEIAPMDASDAEAAEIFIGWIREMNEHFGLPTTFPEIRRQDIWTMADHAAKESNPLYPVPVLMDRSELEDVFYALMEKPEEPNRDIEALVRLQKDYFTRGQTLDMAFRRDALIRLRDAIHLHEEDINAALMADLGKSATETYMCETGMTLAELSYMLKHMNGYARKHYVPTPLSLFSASSFSVKNPRGVTLVMSPWNYPFMLTMEPLIGAIAAGNCCVVKPSAYAPATSAIIRDICRECFPQEYVAVVEGGRAENQTLLDQPFDMIFFTGGVNVGKEVMRRAAERLTPVVLELGGKSPVVVDETAKIPLAAKRIAFGKLLNCGQTCVAPDYILVHRSVHDELIAHLKRQLTAQIGDNALQNPDYAHMVNRKHFDRVMGLIDQSKVVYGGQADAATLRIQPTILDSVTPDDPVMQEEIFGPVIPILTYDSIDEAVQFINSRPHPLACYLFSQDKAVQKRFLRAVPFGGGCINDTIIHLATSRMGFGGVGQSGMGSYHGKRSFDAFSHEKSIVNRHTWMDLPVRYMPYSSLKDKLLRFFLK
ncbi:MAG: iron-containing alcohol dehydrogenase [Christensenellaceae bacterium]|nr:iron-containing alcohol dehydrogenase [Christensenellaceae bacterium]